MKTALIVIAVIISSVLLAGFYLVKKLQNRPPGALASSGYYVRGKLVYFKPGFPARAFLIDEADAASFRVFPDDESTSYATDKNHVYYRGGVIPAADPASFQFVGESKTIVKDKHHVYRNAVVLSDDPAGFKQLTANVMLDNTGVYWNGNGKAIMSTDTKNFRVIRDSGYVEIEADLEHVFINGNIIQGADPLTYAPMEGSYATDKTAVFYFDEYLGLKKDLPNFRVIKGVYAADDRAVYLMGKQIPGALPASFVVMNENFRCAKDARHVFKEMAIIEGMNPAKLPDSCGHCTATTVNVKGETITAQ